MQFSVVCTLIDNDMRHHSGQNLLWTHILTTVMTRIVVDKSSDLAKPQIWFVKFKDFKEIGLFLQACN